jgi:hypothetical protein
VGKLMLLLLFYEPLTALPVFKCRLVLLTTKRLTYGVGDNGF